MSGRDSQSTAVPNEQCPYCGREGGEHNEVCVAAENVRLRKQLGCIAIDALQRNWEDIEEWARGVRVEFPDGSPQVTLVSLVSALEQTP